MTYIDYQGLFRGCVLYLPLNDNSKDYFSNKIVTDVGTPTFTDLGNNKTAYTTSTTSQYSTLSQSNDFSFGSDPFTIFGWFYPTSYAGDWSGFYKKFIGISSYNGISAGWSIRLEASSTITNFISLIFGIGDATIATGTIDIAPNSGWYSYAITKSGTTVALYLNETMLTTGSNTTMYNATGGLQLSGISVWNAAREPWNFVGLQKSIIILKGYALSHSEIITLHRLTNPINGERDIFPVIYGNAGVE